MADCEESVDSEKSPETTVSSSASVDDSSDGNEKDIDSSPKCSSASEDTSEKSCILNEKDGDRVENNTQIHKSKLKPSGLKPSFLRPSQLNAVIVGSNDTPSVSSTSSVSILKPSKFHNPFHKLKDAQDEDMREISPKIVNNINDNSSSRSNGEDLDSTDKKTFIAAKPDTHHTFLPLSSNIKENESSNNKNCSGTSSTSGTATMSSSSLSTPSFVFGQNLKERVAVPHDTESSDSSEKEDFKEESISSTNENGSSELLFSNAAAVCQNTAKPSLTLSEAAQELEEANRASKRKYSEVALLTGEEDETNVLQINCKLFAFDKATASGWQERGRGSIRLNDKDDESRLVARAAGTQRLLLNTKIWHGMTVERAGSKSLRLTAMDVQGDIRIFCIQAAPKDCDQLHSLLLQRLKRAQERQPKKLASER